MIRSALCPIPLRRNKNCDSCAGVANNIASLSAMLAGNSSIIALLCKCNKKGKGTCPCLFVHFGLCVRSAPTSFLLDTKRELPVHAVAPSSCAGVAVNFYFGAFFPVSLTSLDSCFCRSTSSITAIGAASPGLVRVNTILVYPPFRDANRGAICANNPLTTFSS